MVRRSKRKVFVGLVVLLIIGLAIFFFAPRQRIQRIVSVSVVPDWRKGETHLGFEKNKNVTVDRFLNYFNTQHNGSDKQLISFLKQSENHTPEVAIEIHDRPNNILRGVVDGKYDAKLYLFAKILKDYDDKYDKIVYIRPLPEYHGSWNPWGVYNKNNTKEDFIPAFRHIVDVMRSTGNKNIRVQLNVGGLSWWGRNEYAKVFGWENYSKYYPGDAYVDEFSIDVYNLISSPGSKWTSFHDLVINDYNELSLISDKPAVNIGEFSSSNYGGNKTQWILDAFKSALCDFPRMTNLGWFFAEGANATDRKNWALNYPDEVQAFKDGLLLVDRYNNGDRGMCDG